MRREIADLERRLAELKDMVDGPPASDFEPDFRQPVESAHDTELRYRSLIENALDLITVVSGDGEIMFESPSVEVILGYRPDELVGSNILSIVHPDDVGRVESAIRNVGKTAGSVELFEMRVKHRDGAWRCLEASCRNLLDNPLIRGIVVNSRDVTETRDIQNALQDSEVRLRSLVDNAGDFIVLVDRNYSMEFANRYEMGFEKNDIIGTELGTYMNAEHRSRARAAVDHVFDTGDFASYEAEVVSPTGEKRWFRCNLGPIVKDGVIEHATLIATDITDLKAIESALTKSEARLANAQRIARMGNWEWDLVAGKLTWSQEMFEIYGADPDSYEPDLESYQNFIPEEDRADVAATAERGVQEGQIAGEHRIVRPDGVQRTVYELGEVEYDSSGNPLRIIGVTQDISDYKETELARDRTELRLAKMFHAGPSLISITDMETGYMYDANNAFLARLGYERAEVVGKTTMEIGVWRHIDDREKAIGIIRAEGRLSGFESTFVTKSGEAVPVLISTESIEFEGGSQLLTVATDISELKQAEHERSQMETRLAKIFHASPSIITVSDFEDAFVYDVNDTYANVLGYSREEVIGKNAFEIGAWVNPEHRAEIIAEVLRNGFIRNYETLFRSKQGREIPILYSGDVIELNGEKRLLSVCTDISDLVLTREALERAENIRRRFFDLDLIGMAVSVPGKDMVEVNDKLCKILGYSREELLSMTWVDITHPDDVQEDTEQYDKVMAGEQDGYSLEKRYICKDGAVIFINMDVRCIRNPDGSVDSFNVLVQDITERKSAEEAVLRSESRFRNLVDGSIQGLYIHQNLKPIFANQACADIFGYDGPEDIIALGSTDPLIAPGQKDAVYRQRVAKKVGDDKGSFLFKGVRRDGREIWLDVYAGEVEWDGERAVQATFVDVSEKRHAEEQLQQAQKMEAVGQLTGGVAHDFNNLLAVVIGNLELAAEELEEDGLDVPFIHKAIKAANRGADLTHSLLAFSRRQALEPISIDLNERLTGMADMLKRTLGETIEIETELTADLWRCEADPSHMESAVLNLALNARDSMPRGGALTIETSNVVLDGSYAASDSDVMPGEYVMLAVSDTGVGMTPEVIERVFEPFFTTKGVGEGTGLGLSMIYGFVKQSGGHVAIYSEPGEGTTVKLYLPRTDPQARVTGTKPEDTRHVAQAGETILLVEDDQEVRELAVTMLTSLGYEVHAAENARSGLEIIENNTHVDLLFSDVVLPGGMNGPALASEARVWQPDLRVLYMSGYTENAIIHHGRVDKGVILLQKPFRRADLAAKVREALDS